MVIRKNFLTLLIGASIIPVLALADNASFAYGIRSLVTDPDKSSASTQLYASDK